MDDCVWRRAKRAGVAVAEAGRKCMSEEERDLICKEIGDEPGAWAKRRREIEKMSEEDIQAEIRKTREAMKDRIESASQKGRGPGMGKLPLAIMMLCLVGMPGGQVGSFTAYDCSNRSNIMESYSLLEQNACAVSDKTREF